MVVFWLCEGNISLIHCRLEWIGICCFLFELIYCIILRVKYLEYLRNLIYLFCLSVRLEFN
jgi:hypothetical protein